MKLLHIIVLLSTVYTIKAQVPVLIKDINPGFGNSTEASLSAFVLDSLYIFQAEQENTGYQYWVTDGTSDGTNLLKNITPSNVSNPSGWLINYNGISYFTAAYDSIGTIGVWRTNGTTNGTFLFHDTCGTSCRTRGSFIEFDNKLFFPGKDLNGEELWVSDGITDSTSMVKDIFPGNQGSNPLNFFLFNNKLYFTAISNGTNRELWRTDGTSNGTEMFIDLNGAPETSSSPLIFGVLGDHLYFTCISSTEVGRELWRTDGTIAGTVLVKDINPGAGNGITTTGVPISPFYHKIVNNKLLFPADDGMNGREWWISDGTSEGTQLLKDIMPGSANLSSNPIIFSTDSLVIFQIDDDIHGRELWRSDATANGTFLIKDIYEGPESSLEGTISSFHIQHNGKLYIKATDATFGSEIWETDGTAQGTKRLTDTEYDGGNAQKRNLKVTNGYLYFTGPSTATGHEVWKLLIDQPSNIKNNIVENDWKFNAFPNPSTNHLHISGQIQVPSDILVNITNMQGRTLLTQKYNQVSDAFIRTIETTGIPTGLYFLTLQTEAGISTKQISIIGN